MQAFGIELESHFYLPVFPVAQVKLTDDQNLAHNRDALLPDWTVAKDLTRMKQTFIFSVFQCFLWFWPEAW